MAKCTRCENEMGDTIRYAQMVDQNRNWAVRTEEMKPICELCAGEVMAFANTPIPPRKKSTKIGGITHPGGTTKHSSTEQEES